MKVTPTRHGQRLDIGAGRHGEALRLGVPAAPVIAAAHDRGVGDMRAHPGLSEERIGRYISHRRAEYYLASKCGCLVSDGGGFITGQTIHVNGGAGYY
jgi:hypothetical protein